MAVKTERESNAELNIRTEVGVLVSCVFFRLLYAAETRTVKVAEATKLLAFEMRCCRRILQI